jgi:hypothetical protein
MGRGLSKLQQFILCEASKLGRCYYADVLERFYHWEPVCSIERHSNLQSDIIFGESELKGADSDFLGQIKYPERNYFSPKLVGLKEYHKVMATLCRSCARLRDRGLVHCWQGNGQHRTSVELTDRGRAWVQKYLARRKFIEDATNARLPLIITRRRARLRISKGE